MTLYFLAPFLRGCTFANKIPQTTFFATVRIFYDTTFSDQADFGFPENMPTITKLMHDAGYRVGHMGKLGRVFNKSVEQ